MRQYSVVWSGVVAALVGGAMMVPTPLLAQVATGKSRNSAPSVAVKTTNTGWKRQVSVSVLGGFAATGTQLYWFPDPFDPVTGQFAPNRRVAIGPSAVGNGQRLWAAEANSTVLGTFRPGTELVFGLWLPNNDWVFSGAIGKRSVGLQELGAIRPARLLANNPAVAEEGTDYGYYGWGVRAKNGNADYNDFVFMTSQATVTPEPATLSLLGLGLAGLGGVGLRRRRRSRQG